jgi:hypothetical protein
VDDGKQYGHGLSNSPRRFAGRPVFGLRENILWRGRGFELVHHIDIRNLLILHANRKTRMPRNSDSRVRRLFD